MQESQRKILSYPGFPLHPLFCSGRVRTPPPRQLRAKVFIQKDLGGSFRAKYSIDWS